MRGMACGEPPLQKNLTLYPCESNLPPHIGLERGFNLCFAQCENFCNFIICAGAESGPAPNLEHDTCLK